MTTTPSRLAAALCAASVLLAGGCGSKPSDDKSGPRVGGPDTQQDGAAGQFPGASGKVAAVTEGTAQVQGMQGQVAVSWTAATSFTKEVSAALEDVEVGSCVAVSATDQAASGSVTPPTAVTAATVRVTRPTGGRACGAAGPDAGSGPRFEGPPPSGAPSGGPRPQVRAFGGAVGEVTAVSATGFSVASRLPGSAQVRTVTVTVAATTTYTTTAPGAASDVKVGVCVLAEGTTDDTGAVSATTVAVSVPHDGACGGFRGTRA
jgi:Domain of unknown function (DUF5666)